jgi:glyoxylase-like metal-dependent hydrolase (beta-lactamase superfamily II)
MSPHDARYTFRLLRAGSFKLDAGSMFGLIPRSVWSRSAKVDDKGRITVAHNCLLLDRVGPPDPKAPARVLLEAGSGDKLDPKMQDIFELEKNAAGPRAGHPRAIHDALADISVAPDAIDAVVISHLHFDHAGGLTRLARPGESPDWPCPPNDDSGGGSSQTGGCLLTFPRAKVHVQAREWADALANRSVMTKTYYPDHLHPIASRLALADSPRPFPTGLTPDRDELPKTPVDLRLTHIAPGLCVFLVPGHTWGQQATLFREPDAPAGKGRTIVFCPDVLPTLAHVGQAYSLAYDVEPYTSMISRHWLLHEAAERGWVLHLDHEPDHPLCRVQRKGRWFELVPEPV